jgi:potassium efflux system protein
MISPVRKQGNVNHQQSDSVPGDFSGIGENSLEFELRIWIIDANYRLKVISELHQKIDQRFREANIEIAFLQRDVHLRNSDSPDMANLPDP